MIPNNWSIVLLSKFLLQSVRMSLHSSRLTKIARQLAYRDYVTAKGDLHESQQTRVSLTDGR